MRGLRGIDLIKYREEITKTPEASFSKLYVIKKIKKEKMWDVNRVEKEERRKGGVL